MLQLERDRAMEALASLVRDEDARKELLEQVQTIVTAGDPLIAAARERLAHLAQIVSMPIEKPLARVAPPRTSPVETADRGAKVVH